MNSFLKRRGGAKVEHEILAATKWLKYQVAYCYRGNSYDSKSSKLKGRSSSMETSAPELPSTASKFSKAVSKFSQSGDIEGSRPIVAVKLVPIVGRSAGI